MFNKGTYFNYKKVRMKLQNVTFTNWLISHQHKDSGERWLRELYPWPVLAQVECDAQYVGQMQHIIYAGVEYEVTLKSIRWQPQHGTYRYRLLVESGGLGWHARSFCDEYDMCGALDGTFITLFHAKKKEPLEKIAKAFFGREWGEIKAQSFKSLAVSRFLAASIAVEVAELAFRAFRLEHYPKARLVGGESPMLASGRDIWVGYRFFSEDAYAWARRNARHASRVVALYFADTKYQIRTDLPSGAEVQSITQLDSTELMGQHADLILFLLRGLEIPTDTPPLEQLALIVSGHVNAPYTPLTEADVNEALASLKRLCNSKAELRYQLAAGVVLNAWIEEERRNGFRQRKSFYAFKKKIDTLAKWAAAVNLSGVHLWAEPQPGYATPILFVRIDDVDFSFHAIPFARRLRNREQLIWREVRLKPIAPIVLAWARSLLEDSPVQ